MVTETSQGIRVAPLVLLALLAASAGAQAPLDERLLRAAMGIMPGELGDDEARALLEAGLWRDDRTAVLVLIPQENATLALVFRRQPDGSYSALDASRTIAYAAFGYFGWPAAEYERFVIEPLSWANNPGGTDLLRVTIRAWREGQRYSVAGHYLVFEDGSISPP